jgi:hypothetical protein
MSGLSILGYHETISTLEKKPEVARKFCETLINEGYGLMASNRVIYQVREVNELSDSEAVDISKYGYREMILNSIGREYFGYIQ